jgi:hypothetical protein
MRADEVPLCAITGFDSSGSPTCRQNRASSMRGNFCKGQADASNCERYKQWEALDNQVLPLHCLTLLFRAPDFCLAKEAAPLKQRASQGKQCVHSQAGCQSYCNPPLCILRAKSTVYIACLVPQCCLLRALLWHRVTRSMGRTMMQTC